MLIGREAYFKFPNGTIAGSVKESTREYFTFVS